MVDPVTKAIKNTVRAGVREALQDEVPPDNLSGGTAEPAPETPGETASRLLENVPASEGYYLKIYKKHPLPQEYQGKLQFLTHIDDVSAIVDLELELNRLAQQFGWGGGIYQLRLFRRGHSGYQRAPLDLSINPPPVVAATPAPKELLEGMSVMKQVAEAAKTLQELTGGNARPVDAAELSKQLVETLKTGVSIASQAGGGADKLDGLAKTATTVIGLLKDLGLVGPAKASPADLVMGKLLERLVADVVEKPEKADPLEEVARLKELVTVFTPVLGGAAEKTSVMVELARAIGPHIPDMVARITDTVNRGLEVARLRALLQHGAAPGPGPAMLPAGPAAALAILAVELPQAAARDDARYFPRLANLVAGSVPGGGQLLEGLRLGQVTAEQGALLLASHGVADADKPPVLPFLERFVAWLGQTTAVPAAPRTPPAPRPGQVVAACVKCGAEYLYESWRDFEQDSHVCDATVEDQAGTPGPCGGEVRSREAAGEAGPAQAP